MTAFVFSSKILKVHSTFFDLGLKYTADQITSSLVMQFWYRFRSNNGVIQIGWIIALACLFVIKDLLYFIVKFIIEEELV